MEEASTFELSGDAVDSLFPLYVAVSPAGVIEGIGPTLARIVDPAILGQPFFDVFAVEKPRSVNDLASLSARVGSKLSLSVQANDGERIRFRAVATRLGPGDTRLLIDLSLGTDMPETVKRFDLSSAHFRANDASMDLIYSFEAQQALLEDTRKMADALNTAKEEAERKANIDTLTGIANRRALYARIERLLHGDRPGGPFALLQVDLDRFKAVNDTFGHEAGDMILKHTAAALTAVSGPNDLPSRLGGDEFALIVTDGASEADLIALAEDLRHRIAVPIRYKGNTIGLGASVGIVRFHHREETTSDRLLKHGDIALYEAKQSGGTVSVVTPDMIRRNEEVADLIGEIERGIEGRQFIPYFQPQIDTKSREVIGFEVLARWHHPGRGIVPPERFLDAAKRANLMDDIDRSVRRQAIGAFSEWRALGLVSGKLSFNMTASNLVSDTFVEDLLDELLLFGLPADRVQLELLESILFDKADDRLIQQCNKIHEAGFSLALDDFGTGYSAISTLIDVPVSVLKIDRSFITGLDRNRKLRRITSSMLAMAEQIGLAVLAEGVETARELAILETSGCHLFQGYYFAPPLAPDAMTEWLRNWTFKSAARM